MTEIESLLELQRLDMRRRELERTLESLPVRQKVQELEAALEAWRASLAEIEARLARLVKAQKEGEWGIREMTASMAAISDKLYGGLVTNPREIEGLRSKLTMLEAAKAKAEDEVLGFMEEAETLAAEAGALRARIEETAGELERLEAVRDAEVAKLSSDMESVKGEREALASRVPAALVGKYEQLSRDRGGVAVVPVVDGKCGGCHVALPALLITLARPNNVVVKCESCGRILCWVG